MKSPLLQALVFAPRSLRRRSYVRHLGFEPAEVSRIHFKLAETLEERIQSFRVVHDMYVRRGLIDPTPTGLRFTVYSVLPTTAIFAGIRDGRVFSTMSLIEDSPLGVPMEKLYREEIGRLRLERRRFAEVSALAVETESRRKGLALMMYNLMFRWAYFHRGVDDLVIAVHPKAEDFYRSVLLFDRIGGLRAYESLKDAPAVALRLDLQNLVPRYRALYGRRKVEPGSAKAIQNLYHFFCEAQFPNFFMPSLGTDTSRRVPPPAWSHEDVSRLFEEHSFDITSLTSEERRFFILEYPNLDWSVPRGRGFRRGEKGLREGGRTGSPVADALLAAAARAPSSDNTQPWRFTVDSKTGRIAFHLDEGRDPSPLNAGQRMSRLAVGSAIENFLVTARASGWTVEEEAPPAPALAMFRVSDEGHVPPRADGRIVARATNRRRYGGRPLSGAVVERLAEKTPDQEGVTTHWILSRHRIDALAALVGRAETIVLGHHALRRARLTRIRFDRKRGEAVTEGLPVASLELSPLRERFLRRLAGLPDFAVKVSGIASNLGAEAQDLVRSSSGVCLVVAPGLDEAADLAAGRALQSAWLAVTEEGLAAQPMHALISLETILEHAAASLVASLPRKKIAALKRELRASVPEIGSGTPAFLLRFGDAPVPSSRSGRQPLEAVTRQAPLLPAKKPISQPGVAAPVRRSRRPRVLFVGEAISFMHVKRPLALAQAMNPEHYEAVLACDFRFRHLFPPVSFEVIPVRSIPSEQFLDALAAGSPVYDVRTLQEYVEEDLRLMREVRPDVVVGDFRLSLGVSARLQGTPYVCVTEACWSPYARLKHPLAEHPAVEFVGPAVAQALFAPIRTLAFAYHSLPMNVVRKRYGLSALQLDLRRVFTDADYALYVDVPELAPMYELPANHRYLGPILWSPDVPLPEWWNALPRHLPVVVLALGSMTRSEILPVILQALETLPVTVVVETRGAHLPHTPRNAYLADFLPRQRVLRGARILICSGSTSSTHQALAEGVPVVGIVSNMNQHLNMQAVKQAGAGLFVRAGEVEPGLMGDLVLNILARPSYTEAARGLARTLAKYDASTRFQDLISKIPVHATTGP